MKEHERELMLSIMLNLKDNLEERQGICLQIMQATPDEFRPVIHQRMQELFRNWIPFSGELRYPIEVPNWQLSPSEQYITVLLSDPESEDKHIKEYIELRRNLLNFMIRRSHDSVYSRAYANRIYSR